MRLIDADALLKDIEQEYNSDRFPTDRDITDCVRYAPTIDPVKHGRWIEYDGYQVCSNCGEEHCLEDYRASYCEDCGAKMDLEVEP